MGLPGEGLGVVGHRVPKLPVGRAHLGEQPAVRQEHQPRLLAEGVAIGRLRLEAHRHLNQVLVLGQPGDLHVARVGAVIDVVEAQELAAILAKHAVGPVAHVRHVGLGRDVLRGPTGERHHVPALGVPNRLLPDDAHRRHRRVRVIDRRAAVLDVHAAVDPGMAVIVGVAAAQHGIQCVLAVADGAVVVAIDAPAGRDYGEAEAAYLPRRAGLVNLRRLGPGVAMVGAAGEVDAVVARVELIGDGPNGQQVAARRVVDQHVVLMLGVAGHPRGQVEHQVGVGAPPVLAIAGVVALNRHRRHPFRGLCLVAVEHADAPRLHGDLEAVVVDGKRGVRDEVANL